MKTLISFFEIPANDFGRAVNFYSELLGVTLSICECGDEKMAFFPDPETGPRGAVSLAKGFHPGSDGVLIHFRVDALEAVLQKVPGIGGTVVIPATKIEAEGQGYFALVGDTEGNRVGLHTPCQD